MKIIALVPIRNEAWVLPHSLAWLSASCDVVIVSDECSDDDSREICRQFPKVILIESPTSRLCEVARRHLLDAARQFDGCNFLWCTDADELWSPALFAQMIAEHRQSLRPRTVVECLFHHLWGSPHVYRDDLTLYRPYWKPLGVVDDRRLDYDRTIAFPLHEPRVPLAPDAGTIRAAQLPVLHLQFLLERRNQVKQAWYRCREWMNQNRKAADINRQYAITLLPSHVRTAPVPPAWTDGATFPDLSIDLEAGWQEREVLRWFGEHGPAFFEPLEIWHIAAFRDAFRRHVGRSPRPDLSYRPSTPARAWRLARRAFGAARRRIAI